MLDARLHEDTLSDGLRDGIMIIDADIDRIARTSPMNRGIAVS